VTISNDSGQLTSSTTTKTDASVEKQQHGILNTKKLRDIEAQNGSGSPRKIRFQMPMTLPRLSKRSRLRALFTPHKPVGPAPSYGRSLINIIKFSPLNILLAFIPISWALHFTHQSDTIIFVTSALAIMPLAALLGFGTEQIAIRTSSAVAALLNASLGNLTELIIAGICLSRCQLALVQSTLLGGLLSNLLLVLGSAFIVGGFKYPQLSFRPAAAQLNASLLTVGVFSLVVPTAFVRLDGIRLFIH
jgi:Ca2+:H+ antiporter